MAEFELRMKYSTPPMRAGIHILALLFPIWGIAIPTAIALFITLLLRLPANIPLGYSLALIAIMLGIVALCTICSLICDDDEIRVSKDGLAFPLRFLPTLKFRAQRAWQELGAVKLKWPRQTSFGRDESLTLFFEGGGYAQLQLQHPKPEELEQFFIAFESCALNCERDADLPDFEQAIQSRRDGSSFTFTQLWEKSLSHRFTGATFTPLEPDSALQNGRYQILRQLAFGGFAAIYLARAAGGEFVVLKESSFPQSDEVQSKATELFKREATLLGKLTHPNIARLLDYFVENGRHYLVLEHIEGIDLNRLVMQKGALQAESVIEMARQIAAALQYLHEQSPPIVHRDVTPDNLLLKPDGTIMLIDFGAAKEIVSSFTGTIIGKQSYIAPEQFKGKPGTKSDVYGLGATLFFLLTGKQPEPLAPSDLRKVLPEVKEELSELVWRCTSLDENERPACPEITGLLAERTELQPKQVETV